MPLEASPALRFALGPHTLGNAGAFPPPEWIPAREQQHQYEAVALATLTLLAASPRRQGFGQSITDNNYFFTGNEPPRGPRTSATFQRLSLLGPYEPSTPDRRGGAFIEEGAEPQLYVHQVPRCPIHRDKRRNVVSLLFPLLLLKGG